MSGAAEFSPRLWSLWEIMHKLDAHNFFSAYALACTFHQVLALHPDRAFSPSKNNVIQQIGGLEILQSELESIGMVSAATCVKRALEVLKAAPDSDPIDGEDRVLLTMPEARRLYMAMSHAVSRIVDDFTLQNVFVLSLQKASYCNSSNLFGAAVFMNFPSANDDIFEAGMCLALERGTACVMHLMRVLEVGLAALAKALGVSKKNDWGSYIREIDKVLAERNKAAGARSLDEQFYSEISVALDNMRRAWRNPTMHPDKTYSTERAEEILLSVKSFMGQLATRLTEGGLV